MKLTNETLRLLYLDDLTLPDTTHDHRVKVRAPNHWKMITPTYKTAPIQLDACGDRHIWVWSDQHFGHKNIIKYCNRPFPNPELMAQCLIGNYLNVVKPEDVVIFNGDFGFMPVPQLNEILDQLPGYKIQVVGNHDMHRDGKLYALNVDERHLCMVVDVPDHDIEYQMLFTHYPMTNVPENCINVHGHTHQHIMEPHNINVCVEHTNYAPKNLNQIMDQARKYFIMYGHNGHEGSLGAFQ